MKVLIVDDERKVCQLIYHLVDWSEYGMEVAGMINDGREAYEFIRLEKPDIVITDIRMPGLDGIELVEKTLTEHRETYFVIVSGYSQFEYARQAVKLGVEDYLLKPIKKKELQTVLGKISSKYKKSYKDQAETEILKTELMQTREKIKNNLLMAMVLNSGDEIRNWDKEEIRRRYGCTLNGRYHCFIIVHFFENAITESDDEHKFVLEKIQKTLREKLEPMCLEFLSIIHGEEVVCLLDMQEYSDEVLCQQLNKAKNEISMIREIFPASNIAIGVSALLEKLADYKASLERTRAALLNRFADEERVIFREKRDGQGKTEISEIITPNNRKKFLSQIELQDAEAVGDMVQESGQKIARYGYDGKLLYECYMEMVELFMMGIKGYSHLEKAPQADYYKKAFASFYKYADIVDWLDIELRTFIARYVEKQKDVEAKPIRLAKQYITEHYSKTINLETVSSYVGLNPAYFSSVFKKATNQNFNDYVTEVRMENARLMLSHTSKDVTDIAEEVGYSDIKYFSKLFKKNTGLTPSEYRKLYL